MKKLLLFGIILTVCVVIVAFVFAQVYPVGMISYWKFDEGQGTTAFDSVGTNHGNLVDNPTWNTGIVDGALSFDGMDDWVHIQQPFIFHQSLDGQASDATLIFWMKRFDDDHRSIFWTRGDDTDTNRFNIYSGWLPYMPDFGFGFDYRDPNGQLVVLFEIPTPLNEWVHIAVTRSGITYTLYEDGLLVEQIDDLHDQLPTYWGDWYIGFRSPSQGYAYYGLLDEVAIHSRALSACEIYQHYINGLAGKGYTLEDTIETLIINIEGLDLPEGIEKSLASQLDNALDSLERGRDNAAKKQLEAFIYMVEAQRGKKLTDEQADALIIAVQCIIDNI